MNHIRAHRSRAPWRTLIVSAVAILVGSLIVAAPPVADRADAAALPASIVEGGFIISDEEFFASRSMNATDIQNFLNGKVPSCRATTGPACLKDFRSTVVAKSADRYCGAIQGGSNVRASDIIAQVSAACGINPKVILVMLQKEQGLVTSTAPSNWNIQQAMGQACPDTPAGCDPAFSGFFNQVYYGARQLQVYTQNPNSFNYRAGQVNTIQWHPNAACGTSKVYIQNQATANLYIYTPYRANVAALAAGYGTGDACSAYGNRNFYNYYVDWFAPGSASSTGAPAQVAACTVPAESEIAVRTGTATVNTAQLNARTAPTMHCTTGMTSLSSGTTVTVTGEYGMWMRAQHGTSTVWVASSYLTRPATPPPGGSGDVCAVPHPNSIVAASGTVTITTGVLNARLAPSVACSAGSVSLSFGDTATRTGVYGEWWRISRGGATYWIHSGYATVSTSTSAGTPFGEIDSWTVSSAGVRIRGWAIDPDTTAPISVRVKSGDEMLVRVTANAVRSDVAARHPQYGPMHGFDVTVPLAPGRQDVCVVANNVGAGANKTLGCREITPPGGDPFGAVTSVVPIDGGFRVSGWAIDPDTVGPVTVRVKSGDSQLARVPANQHNAVVATRYPAFGGNHGFTVDVKAPAGRQQICVAANNIGVGVNRTIGCADAVGTGGSPFGEVNHWDVKAHSVVVSGWAIDPDLRGATSVRVKAGDVMVTRVTANAPSERVAALHPVFGDRHGFSVEVPLSPGRNDVCVVANNEGPGAHRTLACRVVTVLSGDPFGKIESWTPTANGVIIRGWVIDPDTTGPTSVRVKDGETQLTRVTANLPSPAAAAAHPLYGDRHGFEVEVTLPPGNRHVCVAMNNVGSGVNRTLGCLEVTIASGDPRGEITAWTQTPTGVTISGWAVDPDTSGPISVRVKVGDEMVVRQTAGDTHPGSLAAFPAYGDRHGFTVTIPLASGTTSEVCVVMNNVGPGQNRTLTCRSVSMP